MRIAALVVVGGCWIAVPPPVVPPPEPPPQPIAAASRHAQITWQGRYTCAQGATAVRLTIERDAGVLATFEFGPLDENPGVPRGSYRLTGAVIETGGELEVALTPTEWIEHPANYQMVGVQASTSHQGRILRGKITNPSCSTA